MKTIKTSLFEALKDGDKGIVDMLKAFASLTDGVQKALYEQKVKDADSIDIENLEDVLTPEEIKAISRRGEIKPKECYRNAFVTCEKLEYDHKEVKYCEGYLNMKGFPIEHAFVKVDGHYIDPTIEIALKNDPTEDTYVILGEFTTNQVREIIVENGFWGQIYDYSFLKKYKENIKGAA